MRIPACRAAFNEAEYGDECPENGMHLLCRYGNPCYRTWRLLYNQLATLETTISCASPVQVYLLTVNNFIYTKMICVK